VHDVMLELESGRLTIVTSVMRPLLSIGGSVAGGALAGLVLARKDLGASLAALMGAMYGPVAAVPGILAALIVLAFI
jgi:hypothetical protein